MQPRQFAGDQPLSATTEARAGLAAVFALVAIALLAWLPSAVSAGFAFDDLEAVQDNPVVEGSLPWTAAFQQDYWEHRGAAGHFRPLASLTLRLDRSLWGARGAGFHATNVALHAMVVFAAALLLRRLCSRGQRWPWIGLALFAAHPVLADSVAWISGRSSMLSALFGLCAAIWLARDSPPSSKVGRDLAADFSLGFLGTGLSCLGKEDGAIWAIALACIAARRGPAASAATAAGCLAGVIVTLWLRAQALGTPWIQAPNAPLSNVEIQDRLLVGGRAWLEALRLVAWPAQYPAAYAGDPAFAASTLQAEPVLGMLGIACWMTALMIAGWALIRRRTLLTCASAAALLAWIPFLQLVPSGEVFAPRFLYLPLLFSIPLLHAVIEFAFARRATVVAAILVLVACTSAWSRGRVYASRGAYRWAVLEQRPDDVASWNDLGLYFEEQDRLADARGAWQRATRIDAHYSRAWSNLGRLALEEGRPEEALTLLERAVREGPKNPVALVNLGRARMSVGDAARAQDAFQRAIDLAPGLARGWEGLARALIALGRSEAAREALDRTLELEPANARAQALAAEIVR